MCKISFCILSENNFWSKSCLIHKVSQHFTNWTNLCAEPDNDDLNFSDILVCWWLLKKRCCRHSSLCIYQLCFHDNLQLITLPWSDIYFPAMWGSLLGLWILLSISFRKKRYICYYLFESPLMNTAELIHKYSLNYLKPFSPTPN